VHSTTPQEITIVTQSDVLAPDQEPLPTDAAAFFKGTGARGAGRDRGIGLVDRLLARNRQLEEENGQIKGKEAGREDLIGTQREEIIALRQVRRQSRLDEEVTVAVMGQLTLMLELEFAVGVTFDSFTDRYVAVLTYGATDRGLVFSIDCPNNQLLAEAPALGLAPKYFELDEHGLTPDAELLLYGWINAGSMMANTPTLMSARTRKTIMVEGELPAPPDVVEFFFGTPGQARRAAPGRRRSSGL
jgi:hypothetical protein